MTEQQQQQVNELTQPDLQNLERQLTSALYAVWRAQGKQKRIVNEMQRVEKRGGQLVEVEGRR